MTTIQTSIVVALKQQRRHALSRISSNCGEIRSEFFSQSAHSLRFNILNIFQGHYNEKSWKKIESLTTEEILDTINHKNVSGIFLKDFNFSELLGDIKYDEHGRIIGELIIDQQRMAMAMMVNCWSTGAGAVEMKFYTTVNVTAVKLFGTATRGEKVIVIIFIMSILSSSLLVQVQNCSLQVDYESFDFEGMLIDLLWNRSVWIWLWIKVNHHFIFCHSSIYVNFLAGEYLQWQKSLIPNRNIWKNYFKPGQNSQRGCTALSTSNASSLTVLLGKPSRWFQIIKMRWLTWIFKDSDKLVMGYMLVFVYVNLMLSKMNCVEQRFWLSVIGILR